MERKVLIKIFNRFLKEKGLFSQFYHNSLDETETYYWTPTLVDKDGSTEIFDYDLVNDGFCWEDSYEGHNFWSDISREWVEFFNKKVNHNF